jgi:hypothetical protein
MTSTVATREFTPSLQGMMQAIGADSRSQADTWFRKWLLVLVVCCAGWIAYSFLSSGDLRVLEGIAAGLIGGGVLWCVFFWAMPRLVESRPHNKSAFTARRYKFDAEALSLETSDGVTLRAPYRTFSKISIAGEYILFYEAFPGLAAHVIPSDAFESSDHANMVRGWLAVYAGAAKPAA